MHKALSVLSVLGLSAVAACASGSNATLDAGGDAATHTTADAGDDGSCGTTGCADPCAVAAADKSYVGCEYWPTTTRNAVDTTKFSFAVVVANPSTQSAHVVIDRGGTMVGEADVGAGETHAFTLPWVSELVGGAGSSATANVLVTGGAYHLVSSRPVIAYQFSPFENHAGETPSYSNDASLLLPTSALGNEYRVIAHSSHTALGDRELLRMPNYGAAGFFTVVATQNDTTVTVLSRSRTQPGPASAPAMSEGDTREITLQRGDVLEVFSKLGFYDEAECVNTGDNGGGCTGGRLTDPTGTTVTANHPIAVFGGHECTQLPKNILWCDHLEQQMLPLSAWGKHAIAVATQPVLTNEKNILRVVSGTDANTITLSPASGGPFTLDDGEFVDVDFTDGIEITGTQRFLAVQYMTSGQGAGLFHGGDTLGVSDPSMSIVSPVEQLRSEYIFVAPASFDHNYVNVLVSMAAPLPTIDGAQLSSPTAIAGTTYGFLRVPVSAGAHKMTGSVPFGITVYGQATACSYAYPGGLDVETLVF